MRIKIPPLKKELFLDVTFSVKLFYFTTIICDGWSSLLHDMICDLIWGIYCFLKYNVIVEFVWLKGTALLWKKQHANLVLIRPAMYSLNSTTNSSVEVALGPHYAFKLDGQRPKPQLWLLESYFKKIRLARENCNSFTSPCFTCLHLQSISLHGQSAPGQHQHSRMGNHETSIVIQQALPSPQSSSVITQAPSTNRQIGWVGGWGIRIATEKLKISLCEGILSPLAYLFELCWKLLIVFLRHKCVHLRSPASGQSWSLSDTPSTVSELMSGFCCIWSAMRLMLLIQYCPTAKHAEEGPRGHDEVIVEDSAVTAFTTVCHFYYSEIAPFSQWGC